MDYRNESGVVSGGSDGCINFNDPDNIGLADCLDQSDLASVYDSYCDVVSLADFIVIAGEAVTAATSTYHNETDTFAMGTLASKFLGNFRAGRKTADTCDQAADLLPKAENGCSDLESVFINHIYTKKANMKFRWKLTAAISGAHTIGKAQLDNSGF